MKKYTLTLCLALLSVCAFAQETSTKTNAWGKTKNFLGSLKYEIVAGYGTTVASEPFDEAIVTYNLGATARKDIVSFKENKIGIYGIAGLFYTKRGGKYTCDLMETFDLDKRISVTTISVPLHVGGEYRFNKKFSLFADLGPTLLFKCSKTDELDNLETKAFVFGGGFNMGVRFKRFALSFGLDKDFTNIGKFTPDEEQKKDLGIKSDKKDFDIKTGGFHFDLRWTFGK